MSNTGKFVDSSPFIRCAGMTTASQVVTSDHSLRQDVYFKVIISEFEIYSRILGKNYNFFFFQIFFLKNFIFINLAPYSNPRAH